jgi:hypothetical protein
VNVPGLSCACLMVHYSKPISISAGSNASESTHLVNRVGRTNDGILALVNAQELVTCLEIEYKCIPRNSLDNSPLTRESKSLNYNA